MALVPSQVNGQWVLSGMTQDVRFSPFGDEATTTTLTLGLGPGAWPLVPALNLTLSDLVLTATVIRTPGYQAEPVVSFGASVTGTLTLGEASYAIEAEVPPGGAWYVVITDTSTVPTLVNLAGLAGLSVGQVGGVLPGSLLELGRSRS